MLFQTIYKQHVYSGFEPSQAFDVVYGANFEHRLLTSRLATMEHRHLTLGDARLETGGYNFPVIAQGSMPANALCIGFMAEGCDTTRLNTALVGPDDIQLYPRGAELLYHAGGPSRWITFIVPEDQLQAVALERIGRPLGMSARVNYSLRVHPGRRARLTHLADDAMNLARDLQSAGGMGPELAMEVQQSLLAGYVDALADAVPERKADKRSADRRHYQLIIACEKLALSGLDADMALREIAKRSGYSLRSLQLVFRRGVGMTPGRWFLTARLNGALRDLLTCDEAGTVQGIALKWGFRHMPRFAQYYRRAFGELPSDTLRRPRACL